ncbi:MAG: SMP-30/gluconolactonase/LRE family protein [Acidobacteriaceae bacterium]|nr:SMP-30/gluconolactonase/LRE family protein [Acidobacteriaceae bacterium]
MRFALLLVACCSVSFTASVITTRLDDPKAVYLDAGEFGVRADGTSDDSAAIQAAIDKAEGKARQGIVFVPSGRYRLTRTIYVWPGVRLFGYGATRPVFLLADNTPGFQRGMGVMIMFTGAREGDTSRIGGGRVPFPPPGTVPTNNNIADANSGTFYSAMSNIDFEIGAGNSAAVCIRFHVAQHAFLTHMDFHIGSGLAALYQIGNEAEDLHFYGGRYGILTEKTSPAWQFTLIDSVFEGQREAAIREHEAGLTLIRDTFRHVPTAIDLDPHYSDELWVKDSRFENISGQALIISNENSPLTEIGFENALLSDVPTFVLLRESGRKISGKGPTYRMTSFNFGLIVPGEGMMGTIGTICHDVPVKSLPALPPAIPALPSSAQWTNVHTLGVAGDGTTDDTGAIQKAIDTHRVLYFPSGHYVVRDTLKLRPETVLIGLHPTLTQFDLLDDTPGFQGVGTPRPVISAPADGSNIISGVGVFTGGTNTRAVGVLWRAGRDSLVDDVRFLGGHGSGTNPYNNNHTADPDVRKRWDEQYPSLWVTDGGGGTFADIWTPNTFAQAGFYVSYTKTPGHVYELSNEHHVRNEIRFDHVQNWDLNAPQTEEEAGESPDSLSLEFDWSNNITVANYHAYRVTRSRAPFPAAVRLYQSGNIHFRNVHVNAESGYAICDENGCGTFLRVSKFPYENAIEDITHHLEVREREFAVLDIPAEPHPPPAVEGSAVLAPGSRVQRLEGGFFSISGAAVDASGKLYFVDHHEQRIYGWSKEQGLTVERDNALDPVNLAFDKSGELLIISSAGPQGTVYSFRPGSSEDQITVLTAQQAKPHPGALAVLPVNYWNNGEFKDQLNLDTLTYTTLAEMFAQDVSTLKAREYVSPDGSAFLPAGRVFQQGPADSIMGWRFSDNLDTYGFITAEPGKHIYLSSDSEDVTYSAVVGADGTLTDLRPFAQRGGESVAVDGKGNVYVANGQIFVYSSSGKQIAIIEVPERPIDLVFGGGDRRTLFILAQHALFAARVRGSG